MRRTVRVAGDASAGDLYASLAPHLYPFVPLAPSPSACPEKTRPPVSFEAGARLVRGLRWCLRLGAKLAAEGRRPAHIDGPAQAASPVGRHGPIRGEGLPPIVPSSVGTTAGAPAEPAR